MKWLEFGDEAFKRAKDENKAIFIYVTYPTSKLSSDMLENVIKNDKCQELLDKHFISIKIDRTKRPDLSAYYQKVYKLLNKQDATWPISVFATPQNKPFFAGAYISLESDKHSIEGMGFLELLHLISSKVKNNDESLYQNANEVEDFLNKQEHPAYATKLDKTYLINNLLSQAKENYDTRYNGFGTAPKFLHAELLKTLFLIDRSIGDKSAKAMIVDTLKKMRDSDLWDEKEGGFFRYAKDREWSEAYREKTLQDNAMLCELYQEVGNFYGIDEFVKTAKDIILFCETNLKRDDGFISGYSDEFEKRVFDTNIVTSHNALFAKALLDTKKDEAIRILKNLNDAISKNHFLDDYVFLALGFIKAYNLTKDDTYLTIAQNLTNITLSKFYDNGVLYISDNKYKTKATNNQIGYFVELLYKMHELLQDDKYKHFGFKVLQYNSYEIARKTLLFSNSIMWVR